MNNNFSLALIGCGKWGLNHLKTATRLFGEDLKLVCDLNSNSENTVKQIAPFVSFTTSIQEVIQNKKINSCIVATPASTHFEIGKKLLQNGKHVLIEKPMTLRSDESRILAKIADENNLILMVGHLLLYHPAINEIKKIIKDDKIGQLQYIYSNRLNLGTIRTEENVLWSFAPHDVAILQYLTDSYPTQITSKGASFLNKNIEDTTLTMFSYPNNIHAHIFVSWLHPFKEHRIIVIGSKGMLMFDDVEKQNKLKFYSKGFNYSESGSLEKFDESEITIPYSTEVSPLEEELKDFKNSIKLNKIPIANSKHAIEVLTILEEAERNMKNA